MADNLKVCDEKLFEGLSPCEKEFVLPNIVNPWLLEEFVVNPHLWLKSFPTCICDDFFSNTKTALIKPSVPLVESVENFFLGQNDSPFGNSDCKPFIDFPIKEHVHHGLQLFGVSDTISGILPGSGYSQNMQCYASTYGADLHISSNCPQLSSGNDLLVADTLWLRNQLAKQNM